jgi:hypothetical protein
MLLKKWCNIRVLVHNCTNIKKHNAKQLNILLFMNCDVSLWKYTIISEKRWIAQEIRSISETGKVSHTHRVSAVKASSLRASGERQRRDGSSRSLRWHCAAYSLGGYSRHRVGSGPVRLWPRAFPGPFVNLPRGPPHMGLSGWRDPETTR